jgi:hypothetical protein
MSDLNGMRYREHPAPDLLLRFLRGETSRTEARAIVRHLLAGCPECLAVTRRPWSDGDAGPRNPASQRHGGCLHPREMKAR